MGWFSREKLSSMECVSARRDETVSGVRELGIMR